MDKPMRKTRVVVSSGILTTMLMGLCGFVWGEIKRIPSLEARHEILLNKQKTMEEVQRETVRKIDEIHWHLIRQHK